MEEKSEIITSGFWYGYGYWVDKLRIGRPKKHHILMLRVHLKKKLK